MSHDTTTKPMGVANPSPVTRMWVVIQKLSQARDGYSRAKTEDTRAVLAVDISDLVTQLRTLSDALLEETHQLEL
ncbi:MAG: hypothetical protein K8U57_03265 [Planctomycetes bacterium]|nr:hypothetical protein [Planctomycetota bacterium]